MSASGVLYVVATPIGNLGDISARARETLAAASAVAAEDTRHSGRLLRELGLERPLVSLHEHNERARVAELVSRLRAGENIALVSDAGTPLVSDPGYLLVAAAIEAGITVTPVPGASAAIAALSAAGLPSDRFCFEGFLPSRTAARRRRLAELAAEPRTLVLYEAPHRIADSLADLAGALGAARRACVAREITKRFETFYRGSLGELAERAKTDADLARGESVVLIEGAPPAEPSAAQLDVTLVILLRHLPPSAAAAAAASLTGVRRGDAYARAIALSRGEPATPT
ncbi:MAG TPA: 16S rRNA (cytidine(1402)-2'-O)-methyltransferase [Steroidobacteraceae bacterium]|nr:16S rRNA (cytidine(1402)-2'-O)-methyltransferase [Steroidobacteraceae bacterium]